MAALTYNLKKYLKFITKKVKTKAGVVCEIETKASISQKTVFYNLKSLFLSLSFFAKLNLNPKINLA